VNYDTSNLAEATKQEILRRLQATGQVAPPTTTTSGGITITIGGGTPAREAPGAPITELPNPISLRITAHRPVIRFSIAGGGFDSEVLWVIGVDIGVPQQGPAAGFGTAGGAGITPVFGQDGNTTSPGSSASFGSSSVGSPPATTPSGSGGLRFIPFTEGRADTQANVRVTTNPAQYHAWGRLDFSGTGVNIHASIDPLFGDLLNDEINSQLTIAIQQALALIFARTDLNITPRMALGGVLLPNEQLVGFQQFQVSVVTGFGNWPANHVLSLCINVLPGTAGDSTLVRPFVDQKNFAYFLSESIVRAVLQLRWARLPPPVEFTGMVPIDMEVSGRTGRGRGQVQYRIRDLTEILFDVTTVDLPDAIRFSGESETTLIAAWTDQNQAVADLGSYGNPVTGPYVFRIFPFGGVPPLPPGPAQQFFDTFLSQILDPIYRPSAELVRVREVFGRISSPLHALFVRGQLSL
jgi:hypothetical protein